MKESLDNSQSGFSDPWTLLGEAEPVRDTWLLSFVDILTLFLVLLLVLLMLQGKGQQDANLIAAKPAATPSIAAQPAEKHAKAETPEIQASAKADSPLQLSRSDPTHEPDLIPRVGPRFMLTSLAMHEPLESSPAPTPIPDAKPVPAQHPQEAKVLPVQQGPSQILTKAEPAPTPAISQVKSLRQQGSERLVQDLKLEGLDEQLSISQSQSQVRLETKDSVLFTPGSANLSPTGHRLLQGLAALLKRHPGAILVEGHADNRPITSGTYPSNWELSAARASSVVRYLVEQGLDAERLRALGYGDTRPKADNATAEGRAINRRVSLVLELDKDAAQPATESQSPLM